MANVSFARSPRLLEAASKLPPIRRALFERIYQKDQSLEQAAVGLGLAPDAANAEHRAMLRSLKGAAQVLS